MSLQEIKYIPLELLVKYLRLLKRKPTLTKSVTSALVAALGDTVYQLTRANGQIEKLSWRSIASFAGCGLLVTGPMSHYFYILLDRAVPQGTKFAPIKRLLIDRLLFGPLYLLLILYVRSILEGKSHNEAKRKLFRTYWPILKMSYRVWTIAQYININHVPQQYRVLFSNMVSLGWNVYLASMKQEAKP